MNMVGGFTIYIILLFDILGFLQKIIRNNNNKPFSNEAAVRCPNATSMITDNDPMEGSSKSAIMHHQHNRSHSITSDVSVADSETSLTTGFRNLLNPFLNENINGE